MTFSDLISQLKEFNNTVTLHPNYLFRGQADKSWGLQPSLTRIAKKKEFTRQEILQLERECINRFSVSARNLLPIENTVTLLPNMKGEIDFMGWSVVMQHYSAPTRLLDWSCSPWVALYFACCEGESDGAIFISDFEKINKEANKKIEAAGKEFYPLTIDLESPNILQSITSYNTNERIEAQQGRFLVCTNPLIDHEKLLNEFDGLRKITIPQNMKQEIMNELYHMNITARTLFPGIDGLGKSTSEYCNLWDKRSKII
ncbi:FRG domain-containing protein [Aeromonas rivipollensis]|uniref:FRG domain-containing protein n=1 Tax=Aeromonas rivipollensis TaxID=948519 RepID=UPI0038D20306